MKEEIRAVEFRGGRNPPEGAHKAIVSPSERSPSVVHSISFLTVSCLSGFKQPPHAAPPATRHTLLSQGEQDKKEAHKESTSGGGISDWGSGGGVGDLPYLIFGYNEEWKGCVVHPAVIISS